MTEKSEIKKRPTALVFCCGGGLTSHALKEEGYDVLGGIDYEDFAEKVYTANFPDAKFLKESVRALTPKRICEEFNIVPGEIDCIQISNPCTGASTLGDGESMEAVNDLFFVCTALAFALQPRVVIYENVTGLTRKNMAVLLGMFWAFLQRAAVGYNIDAMILNSWLYGDPQLRDRVFFMCVKKEIGVPVWPETIPLHQRKYIRDVIPASEYLYSRNYGPKVYYNYSPAPTIVAHPDLQVYDGFTQRPVTPREYAGLMGLPDSFILDVGIGVALQAKVLGNGVPWNVMRKIAATVRRHILKYPDPEDGVPVETMKLLSAPISPLPNTMKGVVKSKITWTDQTWNPWVGCTKVSAGCKNCYMHQDMDRWKQNDPSVVRRTSDDKFNYPLTVKEPSLIFTCSFSDFFIEEADEWRSEVWEIIRKTPQHIYQILTKRPERILSCLPDDWGQGYPNVWLGVTVEDQENISRAVTLAGITACVRFISAEPLLGEVDLTSPMSGRLMDYYQWVIVGGESGNGKGHYVARPCKSDWIKRILNDLHQTSVKVFVKQTGTVLAKELKLSQRHGKDVAEFPDWMQRQEFPDAASHIRKNSDKNRIHDGQSDSNVPDTDVTVSSLSEVSMSAKVVGEDDGCTTEILSEPDQKPKQV